MNIVPTPVRLERPATGGAVGHLEDGRVIFVRHAIAGELAQVALTDETSKVCRGDAVEILEASPERVSAPGVVTSSTCRPRPSAPGKPRSCAITSAVLRVLPGTVT